MQGGDEVNPRQAVSAAESHHSVCRCQAQGRHGLLGEGLHGGPFPPSKSTPGSLGRFSRDSSEGHSWATCPAHHGEQAATWRVTGPLPASGRRGLLRTADTALQSGSSCLLGSRHPPQRLTGEARAHCFVRMDQTEPGAGSLLRIQARRQRKQGLQAWRVWPDWAATTTRTGWGARRGKLLHPQHQGAHSSSHAKAIGGQEPASSSPAVPAGRGQSWQATLATTRHLGLHPAPWHPCSQRTLLSSPGSGPQSRWPGASGLQSPAQPPAPPYPAWGPTLYMHLWKSLRTPLSSSSSRATSFS